MINIFLKVDNPAQIFRYRIFTLIFLGQVLVQVKGRVSTAMMDGDEDFGADGFENLIVFGLCFC